MEVTEDQAVLAAMRKIKETVKKIDESYKENSISVPKLLEKVVKLTLENGLPPALCEQPANKLAKYIKDASCYKKRKMAQRISKTSITTKVIISHALQRMEVTEFPFDICLSKDSRKGKIKDGVLRFQKKKCLQTMALGLNKYNRLGINNDEEKVDQLTPIDIPEGVAKVYIGQFHTIFVMKNLDVYGCGKESNFMEGAKGSENIITTPVRLSFIKDNTSVSLTNSRLGNRLPPQIVIKDDSTKILNYTKKTALVIGKCDPKDLARLRATGNNWVIVSKLTVLEENHLANKEMRTTIEVDTYKGTKVNVTVSKDCRWRLEKHFPFEIAFMMDGFRVDSDKFWMNYTVCSNGIIYARVDNHVYKGKFFLGKGAPTRKGDDSDSSDDEDVTDVDEYGFQDVIVLKKEGVLMAVMEELIMPFTFDGFTVSGDGESFIFWTTDDHSVPLETYRQSEEVSPVLSYPAKYEHNTITLDGKGLLSFFDCRCEKFKEEEFNELYDDNGVPKKIGFIRALLEMKHFLRLDEDTKLPKAFINNLQDDGNTFNRRGIGQEFSESSKMGHRIPVISVKADFSSSQSNQRREQIKIKSSKFLIDLMTDVRQLLTKYNEMPHEYSENASHTEFNQFIGLFLGHIGTGSVRTAMAENQPTEKIFKRNHCEEALKERLANNDLDSNDQAHSRWIPIRVEAVAFKDGNDVSLMPSDYISYHIHTTKFHIQCIDPNLVAFINEDDVLDLNAACINNDKPIRFQSLIDSFFLIKDDINHLCTFERNIDVERIAKKIPAKDRYRITTIDGSVIEMPKVLFEVFSEYDAARRRRMDTHENNDQQAFTLDFSAEAIKLALACLIDARVFFRADMDLKMEVYEMCSYCIFTHIRPDLLRMIIQTVSEKHSNQLADLIWREPLEEIGSLIAQHRPDIILFWKNVPIRDNYLPALDIMAKKMSDVSYTKIEFHKLEGPGSLVPIVAFQDEYFKKEIIEQRFAQKFMSNEEQDSDIMFDLHRTILTWTMEHPVRRKRPNTHSFPFNRIHD